MKKRSILWDLLKSVIFAFVLVFIIQKWIVKPVKIVGQSMYPTLVDAEVGFSNVFSRNYQALQRFDIVIVKQPDSPDLLVKRVIGLPNESIEFKNDTLLINQKPVAEPHLNSTHKDLFIESRNTFFTNDFGPVQLADQQYFLMGDNRPFSRDSRFYGPFLESAIVSKSVYIILPLESFRVVGR